MSDTPETDEIALHPATTDWVWREHSRKLERERDEAKKYLKWIHDLADSQKKWTFRTIAKEGLMKMEGGK